ncbi:hypothetical protein QBC35DRAFT_507278 [Podospora australis]|uniref:Nicotinamide-nucleotide adenylyltransferase n=1 Tax=Podospora australis TaxID=1536484 RepID=A0AAN6WKI2_9PEZI|nr:hypothetical protein QBC35DRAFT_507278 [Podospora australis]
MSLPSDLSPEQSESQSQSTMPDARQLTRFFSRALDSFQKSTASEVSIICTRRPNGSPGSQQFIPPNPAPPRARPRMLIVLDSSFNPPTRAHLRMATSAIYDLTENKGQELETLRLLLLLSVQNADKAPKPAAFDQRLAMMWHFAGDIQDILQGKEQTKLLEVDIALAAKPYFHEKSEAIDQADFYKGALSVEDGPEPEPVSMGQVFLVGYDTLIRIFDPKYYRPQPGSSSVDGPSSMQRALGPLFARARLRVTMRTDDEWGGEEDQIRYLDGLIKDNGLERIGGSGEWGTRIEMVKGKEVGADIVSSTYARAAAKDGDGQRLEKMVTPKVRQWIEEEGLYHE